MEQFAQDAWKAFDNNEQQNKVHLTSNHVNALVSSCITGPEKLGKLLTCIEKDLPAVLPCYKTLGKAAQKLNENESWEFPQGRAKRKQALTTGVSSPAKKQRSSTTDSSFRQQQQVINDLNAEAKKAAEEKSDLEAQLLDVKCQLKTAKKDTQQAKQKTTEAQTAAKKSDNLAKKNAPQREKECAYQQRLLARNQQRLEEKKTQFQSRVNEFVRRLHSGGYKKLGEQNEKLKAQVHKKKEQVEEATIEVEAWEDSFASMEMNENGFHCRWSRDEMRTWGVGDKPYPWQIMRLAMQLCVHDAPCSKIPTYIHLALTTFFPELKHMAIPTARTCRTWRLGLLVLSNLVCALKIILSSWLTLHHDQSTKDWRHLGIAVVDTGDGPCMPEGSYMQTGGTASETAALAFTAMFETPQATLDSFRKHLESKDPCIGSRSSKRNLQSSNSSSSTAPPTSYADCLPPATHTALGRVVSGQVPLTLMSDHAPSATAVAPEMDKLLHAHADITGEWQFPGTYEASCGNHKTKGLLTGCRKGEQRFLQTALQGLELDPGEYGEGGIMAQFYRMACKEFCIRGPTYEFGQCLTYESWIAKHFPGQLRRRPSEVGTHYVWHAEMASLVLCTFDNDLAFMLHLRKSKKSPLNKLEIKLTRLLGCVEIKSCVKAMSVMWWVLIKPLQIVLNDSDLKLGFLDMAPFYRRVCDLLKLWSVQGVAEDAQKKDMQVCSTTFITFPVPKKLCALVLERIEAQRVHHQLEYDAAMLWADTDGSTSKWKDVFKQMSVDAYDRFKWFARSQLQAGAHAKTAGDYANPNAKMKKDMKHTKSGNDLGESGFSINDRVTEITPNASSATLRGLTASKMTKPITYIEAHFTEEIKEMIYTHARQLAVPTAFAVLEKEAQQLIDKGVEDEERAKTTKKKYIADLSVQHLLRALMATDMAKDCKTMMKSLDALKTKKTQYEFIALQKKFLIEVGVPLDCLPGKKAPLVEGAASRKDREPLIWGHIIATVLDNFRAGNFDDRLQPRDTLEKQLENLDAFRGATKTKKMEAHLSKERKDLEDLKRQIDERCKSDTARLEELKGTKKGSQGKKEAPVFDKNTVVWMTDEDEEGFIEVSRGKIARKGKLRAIEMPKDQSGSWHWVLYDAYEGDFQIPDCRIFGSEQDATLSGLP